MTREEFKSLLVPLNLLSKSDREFMERALMANYDKKYSNKTNKCDICKISPAPKRPKNL